MIVTLFSKLHNLVNGFDSVMYCILLYILTKLQFQILTFTAQNLTVAKIKLFSKYFWLYLNNLQILISKDWQKLILWTLSVDDELIEHGLEWTVIWLDREMQADE